MVRGNSSDWQHKRKALSETASFERICRYCAYQERSHQEVRDKLFDFGLFASQVDSMLSRLITDGFLNEERFAKAFAGGKFRMKKWGRIKITRELQTRGVTPACIRIGLKEIDEKDYITTLKGLIEKKLDVVRGPNPFLRKDKVARFVIGKGFEPERVWETLKEMTD